MFYGGRPSSMIRDNKLIFVGAVPLPGRVPTAVGCTLSRALGQSLGDASVALPVVGQGVHRVAANVFRG